MDRHEEHSRGRDRFPIFASPQPRAAIEGIGRGLGAFGLKRLVFLAMLLSGLGGRSARAELIIAITNSTAPAGGTGSFDVQLVDTGGTYQVSGFSVEPSINSALGISFTGVNTNTSLSYLFGTYQSAPAPFATDPNTGQAAVFPSTDFVASDTDFTTPYAVTLNSGDAYGLAHVSYQVSSGSSLSADMVNLVSSGTSLTDFYGNAIVFTPVSGFIIIVPEPPALILCGIGLAAAFLSKGLRKPFRLATKIA